MTVLADRLLAVHRALDVAGLPHAFGGAIAYAYCVADPRGTNDIDVNVFVPAERAADVLDALPREVKVTDDDKATARKRGQVRVRWEETPVDVFLDTHAFHKETADRIRQVPFEGTTINVLGCESLVVYKALFNRTKEWADIEAMLRAETIDPDRVLDRLRALVGDDDSAVLRFRALLAL